MKRFEEGTKILIIDAGAGAYGANKKIGIVTNKPSDRGLFAYRTDGFNVELENGEVWKVHVEGTYEVLSKSRIKFLDMTARIKGNHTTVLLENDRGEVSKGVAIKKDEDVKDDKIGVLIAVARALNVETEKINKIIDVMFDIKNEKDISEFTNIEILTECQRRMKM